MDLSPDGLRATRPRTSFRGYDPDEVQAVLAGVADRIAALEADLATARARADAVEAQAGAVVAEAEQRAAALVADAQAQAGAATADAEARAQAIVGGAEQQAVSLTADAEARAAARLEQAETEARAAADAERARHHDELAALAERVRLADEHVRALDDHIDRQEEHVAYLDDELSRNRERVAAVIAALGRLVDDDDALGGLLPVAPPAGEVPVPLPAPDDADVAGELASLGAPASPPEELATSFFDEGTFVDERFLSRRERRRLRRERPGPLGSDSAPEGDAPGASP